MIAPEPPCVSRCWKVCPNKTVRETSKAGVSAGACRFLDRFLVSASPCAQKDSGHEIALVKLDPEVWTAGSWKRLRGDRVVLSSG